MLDSKTKKLLDQFGHDHELSRSAVIRFLAREFFLKSEGGN